MAISHSLIQRPRGDGRSFYPDIIAPLEKKNRWAHPEPSASGKLDKLFSLMGYSWASTDTVIKQPSTLMKALRNKEQQNIKTRKTPEPRGQMERSKVMMQSGDGAPFSWGGGLD